MPTRLAPYLLLTAAALLFFAPLVLRPTGVLYADSSDLIGLHVAPWRFLLRSWRHTGELPLWNPYSFAGMPFAAHDIQVAAFYPPHLALYAVPEAAVPTALSWLVAAHVLMAGWTMFLYARAQGLVTPGALVAALGFMFAGKWMIHLLVAGHYMFAGLAWLPLLLLMMERALRGRSLRAATWAGVIFALMILGTHPQITFYAGLFAAVWTFGTALQGAGYLGGEGSCSRQRTVTALGWWVGIGAWTVLVAFALASVTLLPALEAAGQSSRGQLGETRFRATGLLDMACSLFGPPYSGPLGRRALDWEYRGGLDVLWVAAALVAPFLSRGRVRYEAGVALCLIAFALGGSKPFEGLPGLRLFSLHLRMLLIAALPLALLAGRTTTALLEGSERGAAARRHARRALVQVTTIALLLDVIPILALGTHKLELQRYWAVLALAVPAAFCLLSRSPALSSTAVGGGSGGRWALAWSALLLTGLWAIGWPFVAVRDPTPLFAPSACVRYLAEHAGQPARVLERSVLGDVPRSPLGSSLPLLSGIEVLTGYNALDIQRYKEYIQFISNRAETPNPRHVLSDFPISNPALLDLLGVRFLLQPSDPSHLRLDAPPGQDPGSRPAEADPRWRKVAEDPHPHAFVLFKGLQNFPSYSTYENREALPRAFVVPEAAPMPDGLGPALRALKANDFRRRVLLEGLEKAQREASASGGFRPATIREYRPNRVVIGLDGGPQGYLVLADIWFPGWTCTVDGRPAKIERANYTLRGVALPTGAREVVFRFEPASFRRGLLLSSLALCMVGITAVRSFRPRACASAGISSSSAT